MRVTTEEMIKKGFIEFDLVGKSKDTLNKEIYLEALTQDVVKGFFRFITCSDVKTVKETEKELITKGITHIEPFEEVTGTITNKELIKYLEEEYAYSPIDKFTVEQSQSGTWSLCIRYVTTNPKISKKGLNENSEINLQADSLLKLIWELYTIETIRGYDL